DGLCAVVGPNGVGKSNLLEAVGYLSLLESFRGAPTEALIRAGASSAVVRGQIVADGREQLIEAERSEEHTSELQSRENLVCRLLRPPASTLLPYTTLFRSDGLCAVVGPNGVGKSNLLEAVGYLSLLESFRGAPTEALIRAGASSAVVRGQIVADGREQLIEAE